MVTFVLAGVLGSVLAVGEAAAGSAQARPLPSGGLETAGAARALLEPPARASAPYKRLFSDPAETGGAVGPHRLIRFGRKQTPDVAPDAADGGPCRLVEPPVRNDIDPGIFAPRRDPQIDFKIRRIVPKGCIDPGIFIPKRQQ
jgi:hypothetical protein